MGSCYAEEGGDIGEGRRWDEEEQRRGARACACHRISHPLRIRQSPHPLRALRPRDRFPSMDFRLSEEQEILRRTVREFAESGDASPRDGVGRGAAVPDGPSAEARVAGPDGDPVSGGGSAASGDVGASTTASASKSSPASVRRSRSRWRRTTACAPRTSRCSAARRRRRSTCRGWSRGEVLGAWGLTEASAGSDAAAMRTTAMRSGDGWVLNGSKNFITHGKIGGVMVAMAVTDRAKGHRGISAFVLEHGTPGMSAGKKENKLGMRASDTSEVVFQDCRVPASALLGRGRAGVHQHAAGPRRRPHRHRRALGRPRAGRLRSGARGTRRSGGSSASRSRPSRRSSGSSPTMPRASKRPGS